MTISSRTTTARIAAASLAVGLGARALTVATAPAGASTKTIKVTEQGNKLVLSKTTFSPGTYTFVVTNKGTGTGTFRVSGPGLSASSKKTVAAGKTVKMTVTFKNGSYILAGKNLVTKTLTVSGSSGRSSSGSSGGGYGY